MTVVSLVPNHALANDQPSLADKVRALADRIEKGAYPDLHRIIVLADSGSIHWEVYGRPCNRAEVVGLLEYAKLAVIDADE